MNRENVIIAMLLVALALLALGLIVQKRVQVPREGVLPILEQPTR